MEAAGEGCAAGEAEDVDRALTVLVKYLNEQGEAVEMKADGLLAIAIQHETDHLKGVMFVDHVSMLKRELIRKKMKKLQAEMEADKADAEPLPSSTKSKSKSRQPDIR